MQAAVLNTAEAHPEGGRALVAWALRRCGGRLAGENPKSNSRVSATLQESVGGVFLRHSHAPRAVEPAGPVRHAHVLDPHLRAGLG